jgi:hypothetical protein
MYGINIVFDNKGELILPIGTKSAAESLLHKLVTCKNDELCRLTRDIAVNLKHILVIKIVESNEIIEEGVIS